jgi:uncharacterized protein
MHAFARLLRRAVAPLLAAALWLPFTAARADALAPIPALDAPVVDTTGTLSAADVSRLQAQALDLQTRKGSQLQILIVPTTAPESIEQYAQRVFDQWKLGRKGVDDGVLLLVAKDDHQARIQTGYGLEGAIPDITAGRVIQEYLVPKFRAGDFAGGLDDATAQLVRLIDGESLPAPMAPSSGGKSGGDSLFLLVFLLFFFRGLFGWLPTPVRMAVFAGGAGLIAWVITHAVPWTGLAALFGLVIGALGASTGRYARDSGWGGWGGGSSGGGWSGGGGGWSGGGGSSGGGGASGSW